MQTLMRIALWLLGAVLMVTVGVLIIKWVKPLNNFVFGVTPGATGS